MLAEEGRGGLDELRFKLGGEVRGARFSRSEYRCHTSHDVALAEDRHGAAYEVSRVLGDCGELRGVVLPEIERACGNEVFKLGRELFVAVFLARNACAGDHGVAVADDDSHVAYLVKCLGVLRGKAGQLADRRIFFEDDLAFAVGVDLKRVALADTHGAADLLRDNDPSEVVDSAHDSCCFHYFITIAFGFPKASFLS